MLTVGSGEEGLRRGSSTNIPIAFGKLLIDEVVVLGAERKN